MPERRVVPDDHVASIEHFPSALDPVPAGDDRVRGLEYAVLDTPGTVPLRVHASRSGDTQSSRLLALEDAIETPMADAGFALYHPLVDVEGGRTVTWGDGL